MKKLKLFRVGIALVTILAATGCGHSSKHSADSNKLFPDGIYHQSVRLSILDSEKKEQNIPFTSLSKIENGSFQIKGFTPFGTPAFKAYGKLQNPDSIKLKFFMEIPEVIKPSFIKKTLFQMQSLQSLKKSDLTSNNNISTYKKDNLKLTIYKFNNKDLPIEFKVSNPKWKAFIKTSKFKPL